MSRTMAQLSLVATSLVWACGQSTPATGAIASVPAATASFDPAASATSLVSLEFTFTSTWAEPNPFWWQLSIAQDGAAVLRDFPEGQPRVQQANLGPQQVQLLGDYLKAVHFTEWAPRYEASALNAFDAGEYTLVVKTGRGSHSFYSYSFDAPPTLWVFQEALANIRARAHWHEVK